MGGCGDGAGGPNESSWSRPHSLFHLSSRAKHRVTSGHAGGARSSPPAETVRNFVASARRRSGMLPAVPTREGNFRPSRGPVHGARRTWVNGLRAVNAFRFPHTTSAARRRALRGPARFPRVNRSTRPERPPHGFDRASGSRLPRAPAVPSSHTRERREKSCTRRIDRSHVKRLVAIHVHPLSLNCFRCIDRYSLYTIAMGSSCTSIRAL